MKKNLGADYFDQNLTCVRYRKEHFQYMEISDPEIDVEEYVDYTDYVIEQSLLDKKPYYFYFYNLKNSSTNNKKAGYGYSKKMK